jgi:hypothetical protein
VSPRRGTESVAQDGTAGRRLKNSLACSAPVTRPGPKPLDDLCGTSDTADGARVTVAGVRSGRVLCGADDADDRYS